MNRIAAGMIGLVLAAGAAAQAPTLARVTLAAPTQEQAQIVAGDAIWRCDGATCVGPARGGKFGQAALCRDLARQVGTIASFEVPGEALGQEQLDRCNKSARRPR